MRRLAPILRRFNRVQVVKLRKIGKNPKNFHKNLVFEANKIAQAENFWNLCIWPERAFSCGCVFKILNCLGEIGLEKTSRNFYKCRGMSRFGEKKLDANNKAPRFARRLKKLPTVIVGLIFYYNALTKNIGMMIHTDAQILLCIMWFVWKFQNNSMMIECGNSIMSICATAHILISCFQNSFAVSIFYSSLFSKISSISFHPNLCSSKSFAVNTVFIMGNKRN